MDSNCNNLPILVLVATLYVSWFLVNGMKMICKIEYNIVRIPPSHPKASSKVYTYLEYSIPELALSKYILYI